MLLALSTCRTFARLPGFAALLAVTAVACAAEPSESSIVAPARRSSAAPHGATPPPSGALPGTGAPMVEAGANTSDAWAGGHDAGESDGDGVVIRDSGLPRRDAAPPRPTTGPWIFLGELVNARDVGGVIAGTSSVAPGSVYRGPPLTALSPRGCDEFARRDIHTVIDLRVASERGSTAAEGCVVQRAQVVSAPLPVPYNVSGQDYIAILNASDSIAAAFHVLGNAASYPVYVNCTWGRDRTGVVVAAILWALGVSRAAILDEYLLSQPTVGAFPGSLTAALDEIERRGGIAAYLASVGVTETELAVLRARVLVPSPSPSPSPSH